jgi:hypothetical protein
MHYDKDMSMFLWPYRCWRTCCHTDIKGWTKMCIHYHGLCSTDWRVGSYARGARQISRPSAPIAGRQRGWERDATIELRSDRRDGAQRGEIGAGGGEGWRGRVSNRSADRASTLCGLSWAFDPTLGPVNGLPMLRGDVWARDDAAGLEARLCQHDRWGARVRCASSCEGGRRHRSPHSGQPTHRLGRSELPETRRNPWVAMPAPGLAWTWVTGITLWRQWRGGKGAG